MSLRRCPICQPWFPFHPSWLCNNRLRRAKFIYHEYHFFQHKHPPNRVGFYCYWCKRNSEYNERGVNPRGGFAYVAEYVDLMWISACSITQTPKRGKRQFWKRSVKPIAIGSGTKATSLLGVPAERPSPNQFWHTFQQARYYNLALPWVIITLLCLLLLQMKFPKYIPHLVQNCAIVHKRTLGGRFALPHRQK